MLTTIPAYDWEVEKVDDGPPLYFMNSIRISLIFVAVQLDRKEAVSLTYLKASSKAVRLGSNRLSLISPVDDGDVHAPPLPSAERCALEICAF